MSGGILDNVANGSSHVYFYDEDEFHETKPGFRRRIMNGDTLSLCFWRIAAASAGKCRAGEPW